MAGFDGNGTYVRPYNWTNDAANGLPIDATKFDTDGNDVATALSLCLTRDNQGKPSATLDWVQSLKLTAAGAGPTLTLTAFAANTTNALVFPTAGSLIQMARSSDGSLHGYVGSRSGTSNFSLYNDGGTTAEVSVGGGTVGIATATAQRIAVSAVGLVTINAPDSGPSLIISATAVDTTNAVKLFTAGSMINFARSADGSLSGFVGSRTTTTSFSVYNSGGTTAEVEVDAGTINLSTNAIARMAIASAGNVTITAPASGTVLTTGSNQAIVAGGSAKTGIAFSATATFGVFCGSGAPSMTAAKGSLYLRSDGSSASTRVYVASDSAGTWVAVTTAS